MKKIIFFCDRPIHVLTSIIIAFHIFEEEHTKSDICIFSSFSDSQRIAELLKKIGIFNQVLYLEKNRTSCRLMTKILSIFQYNETSRAQYFRNWILKQYISKTNLQGIDWQQYTVIFTASWGTPLWRELVFMLGKKKYQVNFYDDGVNSYINTDYIELRPKTLGQRIKKLFKHGKYGIHVVKNFLYNPTMIMYSSDKIQKIHFDLQNKELYKIIQNVYEFKKKNLNSNLEEAYFLEQDISRKDAKNINDIRKTLITLLMSSSIINKLHFRLHPIQKFYPISSSFLDENKNIWELECAYGKITDESILTGFSSSALITPKLWFDKEPEVVCLYPLLKWNDTDRFLELDNFFKMIQRSYRNPKKFIIINTLEEFEAYLEKR